MSERDTGAGRGAKRGSDARHDEAVDAIRGEHFEFLTSAAEHAGIAALEARDALTLACEVDQQLVDARLMGVLAGLLADEDPLRITARSLEHSVRHRTVVENHVSLLQQLQGSHGEQVRVARAGSDEVDLSQGAAVGLRGAELRVEELAREGLRCRCLVSGQHTAGGGAARDALPERAAPRRAESSVDLLAP